MAGTPNDARRLANWTPRDLLLALHSAESRPLSASARARARSIGPDFHWLAGRTPGPRRDAGLAGAPGDDSPSTGRYPIPFPSGRSDVCCRSFRRLSLPTRRCFQSSQRVGQNVSGALDDARMLTMSAAARLPEQPHGVRVGLLPQARRLPSSVASLLSICERSAAFRACWRARRRASRASA